MMPHDYRPKGFPSISPYLILEGANQFLAFVQQAFGAKLEYRMDDDAGQVVHAELWIDGSPIEFAEANEQFPARPGTLHFYVADVDQAYQKALEAGASKIGEPRDEFYGDRACEVKDPCGNYWFIATRKEHLSDEEISRRATEAKR